MVGWLNRDAVHYDSGIQSFSCSFSFSFSFSRSAGTRKGFENEHENEERSSAGIQPQGHRAPVNKSWITLFPSYSPPERVKKL